jgi:hypothetical protein
MQGDGAPMRVKPLSRATVEHLNTVLERVAERAEKSRQYRDLELARREAERYASQVLAVAIEMARDA